MIEIETLLPFFSLGFGILLLIKLNPINVNTFLRKEAKRGLKENFKIDDTWHSQGRVFTKGLTFIEEKESGKQYFVRQAKLADTGLLH